MHGTDLKLAAKINRGVHQHLEQHHTASPRSKMVQANDGMRRAKKTRQGKISATV
jgi:hypothetical protein